MGTRALMRVFSVDSLVNFASDGPRTLWGHLESEPEKSILLFKQSDGKPTEVFNDLKKTSRLAEKLFHLGYVFEPEKVAALLISSSMVVMPLSMNWQPLRRERREKDVSWEYVYLLALDLKAKEWQLSYWALSDECKFPKWNIKHTGCAENIPEDIKGLSVYEALEKFVYSKTP